MALLQSLNPIAWIRFEVVGHVIAILASEASEGPVKHKKATVGRRNNSPSQKMLSLS